MENVNDSSKSHCVDGAIAIAVVILDDFQRASAAEALQRLCGRVFTALLRDIQRVADFTHDRIGEREQVFFRRSNPSNRPQRRAQ